MIFNGKDVWLVLLDWQLLHEVFFETARLLCVLHPRSGRSTISNRPFVRSNFLIFLYQFIHTWARPFFLLKLTAYFSSTPFQINETVNNRRSIYVREDHRRYTLHVCYPPFYTDLYAYFNRLLRLQIWNKHLVNGWDNSIIVY